MKNLIIALIGLLSVSISGQTATEIEINPLIKGTLFTPATPSAKNNLVILIAGSGPTNRSGNQIGVINNSLKFLAEGLATKGHYVYSYDKRIIAQMIARTVDEKSLRFTDFITDAKDVIKYFRATNKYDNIIVAGHSEGSLIGMIAANGHADAFISLAGAGHTIDKVIVDQTTAQTPSHAAEMKASLEKLKKGDTVRTNNPVLYPLLRKDIQPYLLSWMALDPQQEIKKLAIPTLIINGTRDSQVSVSEAEALKAARPDARLHIIPNMNHVLKEVIGDDAVNLATYNNPKLPVMPELVETINDFIKSL